MPSKAAIAEALDEMIEYLVNGFEQNLDGDTMAVFATTKWYFLTDDQCRAGIRTAKAKYRERYGVPPVIPRVSPPAGEPFAPIAEAAE